MSTKNKKLWQVSDARKSHATGQKYHTLEGEGIVRDYEDWGFTPEAVRLVQVAPEMAEALEFIATICEKEYLYDTKLRANGARTLKRCSERARAILKSAGR